MHNILSIKELAPNIKEIILEAPLIAKKILPGQFIVLIVDKKGERIPLTVAESNNKEGTITIIFQEVGKTTCKLGRLKEKDQIMSLLGPLGKATEIKKGKRVITIGGGVGIAEIYPVTKAFKENNNRVISIIGARNKSLLILENKMKSVSEKLFITTDDGSYGRKGFVSDVLKESLSSEKIDLVYAVGPVAMMQTIADITRPYEIKTLVSLNPIMVDATGMCGACRVSINGQTQFGCVDGPEFNAHLVDFDQLQKRLKLFCQEEKKAMQNCKK